MSTALINRQSNALAKAQSTLDRMKSGMTALRTQNKELPATVARGGTIVSVATGAAFGTLQATVPLADTPMGEIAVTLGTLGAGYFTGNVQLMHAANAMAAITAANHAKRAFSTSEDAEE